MRTVWKFKVPLTAGIVNLDMPKGAKIVHADINHIWAECDSRASTERIGFAWFGTGWTIEDKEWQHVQTVIDGMFVWHLYRWSNN